MVVLDDRLAQEVLNRDSDLLELDFRQLVGLSKELALNLVDLVDLMNLMKLRRRELPESPESVRA